MSVPSPDTVSWLRRTSFLACVLACTTMACYAARADPPAVPSRASGGPPAVNLRVTAEVQGVLNQGRALLVAHKNSEAVALYEQALDRARVLGDRRGESEALRGAAIAYRNMRQPQQALEMYQQALPLFRAAADKVSQARVLSDIGIAYEVTGRPQKALEAYQEALLIFREIGDKKGEASTLGGVANNYVGTGQPEKALRLYQEALPIFQAIGDKNDEALALVNCGICYHDMHQYRNSLGLLQEALPIFRSAGDSHGEASTLTNISSVYCDMGEPKKALPLYLQALVIHRASGNKYGEAITLNNIGTVYKDSKDFNRALSAFQQALLLNDQGTRLRSMTLDNISIVERGLHRPIPALSHARQAVAILEGIRASLGGYGESKSAMLTSQLPVYYSYLDQLVENGRVEEAFAFAQKTKGRALLDLLASGRVALDGALSEGEKGERNSLLMESDALNKQMVKEGVQNEVGSKKRFAELQQKQQDVEGKLQTLTDTFYARHPGLADKQVASTATLSSLSSLLPADTALLDYVEMSYNNVMLFVVTTEGGKARIKVSRIAVTAKASREMCAAFRASCADPRRDYRPLADRLSKLLISPALSQIADRKRLVFCPDSSLWDVPFQALTLPSHPGVQGQADTQAPVFLWERYDVAYAYSATGVQASLRVQSHRGSQPTGSLFVMANPDFGSSKRFEDLDDPSDPSRPLSDPSRPLSDPSRPLTDPSRPLSDPSRPLLPPSRTMTAALETRGGGIAALPGTQREANALRLLFADAAVFTGAAAQESTAKEQMGNYRYLHFATHGFLNDAAPLLSSIVLAQPDKSDPKAGKEDGFLTAREVFDLKLQADLVTLSACNTGRGAIRTGEGIVGLSWAFFVAGVPTQVVSQWSVDDAATAQLMRGFYTALKAGEGKSQALRHAAMTLKQEKAHRHPYYWAPFILMGDWRH